MLQNCFPCFKHKINQEHTDINILCNITLNIFYYYYYTIRDSLLSLFRPKQIIILVILDSIFFFTIWINRFSILVNYPLWYTYMMVMYIIIIYILLYIYIIMLPIGNRNNIQVWNDDDVLFEKKSSRLICITLLCYIIINMWYDNLTTFDVFFPFVILTAEPQFSPQMIHFHIVLVDIRPCEMVTSENGFTANLFLFFTINMGILSIDKSNNDPRVFFFSYQNR